jgi:hypothetical protein
MLNVIFIRTSYKTKEIYFSKAEQFQIPHRNKRLFITVRLTGLSSRANKKIGVARELGKSIKFGCSGTLLGLRSRQERCCGP